MPTIVVIADLEEFRRRYDKGFTKKNLVRRDCPGYFPTNFNDWGPFASDRHRNHSHARQARNFEDDMLIDNENGGSLDPLCNLCLDHSLGELPDFFAS